MFLQASVRESPIFFRNEGGVQGALCKNSSLADLLGSLYLFEILQTSFNLKNSKNVVKSERFEKRLQWTALTFFWNEGGK